MRPRPRSSLRCPPTPRSEPVSRIVMRGGIPGLRNSPLKTGVNALMPPSGLQTTKIAAIVRPMSIVNSIRSQLVPIHREGYPFVGVFALVSLILFLFWAPLGWIGTVLTVWCALFFRDPVRVTPVREGIVVAPAAGRIPPLANPLPPPHPGPAARPLPRL